MSFYIEIEEFYDSIGEKLTKELIRLQIYMNIRRLEGKIGSSVNALIVSD